MQISVHLPARTKRASAGFSLVEILISLGIFLIGMTAIVSLFPAAAILQRETTEEVISEMAAQSAASIIESQQLSYEWSGTASSGNLAFYHTSAASTNSSVEPIVGLYPFTDRSYPTGLVNNSFITNANTTDDGLAIFNCDLFWIPFIQDLNGDPANPNWVVRLFILNADSRASYSGGLNSGDPNRFPRLFSANVSSVNGKVFMTSGIASGDIEPGDTVMDSNGNSHSVVAVGGNSVEVYNSIPRVPNAPTLLWYAPPQGSPSSPAQRIVTVEVNVVAP